MPDHQLELIREEHAEYSALDQSRRDEYRRRLVEFLKDPVF